MIKLHPTYEIINELMLEKTDSRGEPYCEYDQDKLSALMHHEKENDELVKKFIIPSFEGGHNIPAYLIERTYTPDNAPLLLVMHGGGFTTGSPAFDYNRIAYITKNAGCRVLTVDYRLAQNGGNYPGQLYDCYSALLWAYENAGVLNIDKDRIAVGGYSSGASLACALSIYARDNDGPKICCQILTNPVLKAKGDSPSALRYYKANVMLSGNELSGMIKRYLGKDAGQTPACYAFPGYCENVSGLPPTVMIAGEYDPLRDECIEFAQRLYANSVPCELYCLPRVPHSFDLHTHGCMTPWIWDAIIRALKREFGTLV